MRCRILAIGTLLLVSSVGPFHDKCRGVEPADEAGFVPIFNGKNLEGWQGLDGVTSDYYAKDGMLICSETGKKHLFTTKEYANFILRLEIKMDPGGNNGIGIRAKVSAAPHLEGNEIQVLDDPYYARGIPDPKKDPKDWVPLKDYQHFGSLYGVVPAKTGHLKPAGQWNVEEIVCNGSHLKVTLNGAVIVDADMHKVEPLDHQQHPGLKYEKGLIGLHAHGNYGAKVYFRNLRVKELK